MSIFSSIFGPPSPDRFAANLTRALRACGINEEIVYDAKEFVLRIGEPTARTINLGNVYSEHCAIPRKLRKAHIETLAEAHAGFTEYPDDLASARSHLMPRIRTSVYRELITLQLKAMDAVQGTVQTTIRPINEVWSAELVFDSPGAVGSISPDRLQQWGITDDEALKIACDNLWKLTDRDLRQVRPGLYLSTWEDGYDATRLLLDTFVWRHTVKGEQVVFCPTNDAMIVTGSRDSENLIRACQMVEELITSSPRPLTGIAVCRNGSVWERFLPSSDEPAYPCLKRLLDLSMAAEYNEQKQFLELLAQNRADRGDVTGLDPAFPATFSVAEEPRTNLSVTYSVWGDVETLLPVTERVAFVRSDTETGVLGMVEWDRVVEVCGHLMEKTDYVPIRYRVAQFPAPELMARLSPR